MSRKLFSFLSDSKSKQRTIKVVEETNEGSHFERRVSVSNSGRWKQKNKHRSVVNDDLFSSPKKDSSVCEKQTAEKFDDKNTSRTANVSSDRTTTIEDAKSSKLETAL